MERASSQSAGSLQGGGPDLELSALVSEDVTPHQLGRVLSFNLNYLRILQLLHSTLAQLLLPLPQRRYPHYPALLIPRLASAYRD